MKKGLSFTLTLVVVGVILLMTALSVITLGGSSLNSFFNTAGDQRDSAQIDAEVRQRCEDLMADIQTNYCSQYVHTATYQDDTDLAGTGQAQTIANYDNNTADWESAALPDCSSYQGDRLTRTFDLANRTSRDQRQVYEQTAGDAGCDWREYYQPTPTVTYQGTQYSCLDRGGVQDTSCPAQ